jgi:uncharacterized SAM-binding protein YcdF (DUF218 family)
VPCAERPAPTPSRTCLDGRRLAGRSAGAPVGGGPAPLMGFLLTKVLTQLAYPLSVGLGLGVLSLGLLLSGRRRAAIGALTVALVGLWLCSAPITGWRLVDRMERVYPPVPPERSRTADAIVVLGGGVDPPAPPLHWMDLSSSADRMLHAARLYRAGKARWVIASGGNPWGACDESEAEAMASLLEEWGVPRTAILLDRQSRNTWQNAAAVGAILTRHDLHDVLLVTSALHMRRALETFRRMGIQAYPAPTDYDVWRAPPSELMSWLPDARVLERTSLALKELAGTAVYRLRRPAPAPPPARPPASPPRPVPGAGSAPPPADGGASPSSTRSGAV